MGPPAHSSQGDPLTPADPARAVETPASPGCDDTRPGGQPVKEGGRGARRRAARPGPASAGHTVAQLSVLSGADLMPLVAAAKAGDRAALDELVRATYGATYTLAFRLTGNEDDARDVVQDAYLRAYKGLRRFRGDAQFTTWLYRITANCSANLLAKRARHRTEPMPEEDQVVDLRAESDPGVRAEAEAERAAVARAVSRLPAKLRQVIVLRDIYDLPHAAIATELGITEAAAKVRLHRARRNLREVLIADRSGSRPGRRAGGLSDRGKDRSSALAG